MTDVTENQRPFYRNVGIYIDNSEIAIYNANLYFLLICSLISKNGLYLPVKIKNVIITLCVSHVPTLT